jgi:hypothetical protein
VDYSHTHATYNVYSPTGDKVHWLHSLRCNLSLSRIDYDQLVHIADIPVLSCTCKMYRNNHSNHILRWVVIYNMLCKLSLWQIVSFSEKIYHWKVELIKLMELLMHRLKDLRIKLGISRRLRYGFIISISLSLSFSRSLSLSVCPSLSFQLGCTRCCSWSFIGSLWWWSYNESSWLPWRCTHIQRDIWYLS